MSGWLVELLGEESQFLLEHESQTISRDRLHLPGPDFVNEVGSRMLEKSGLIRWIGLVWVLLGVYLSYAGYLA